jgi:lipopolysaccharide export LptBFGC system permease protein LptF
MILFLYLLRAVIARLALALPALCLIVMAFDLGDQGKRLVPTLGWAPVLRASALHLPLVAVQILPAALLLSAVLALSSLRRRGELVAMAGAGATAARLCAPLLTAGLACAAGSLLLDEIVVPLCEQRADSIYGHKRTSPLTGLQAPPRWIRQGPWFFHRAAGTQEVLALEVSASFQALRRLDALGTPGGALVQGRLVRFGPEPTRPEARVPPLPGLEMILDDRSPRAEAQSFLQLRRALRRLGDAGQLRVAEELVLHTKLAFPLVNLVMGLWACSFALGRRRTGPAEALGVALVILLGSWLLIALGWVAARVGWISPTIGAWAPLLAGMAGALACAIIAGSGPRRRRRA